MYASDAGVVVKARAVCLSLVSSICVCEVPPRGRHVSRVGMTG